MADWWYVIAIAGIALAGIRYMRSRTAGNGRSGSARQASTPADRDYKQEREDDRHAHMSDEDRAWEAASLQRNRELRARDDTPAEHRAPLG